MTPTVYAVVDVSVAVKWLFGEPGSAQAVVWRDKALAQGVLLCAPEYLLVELHNVIWKKVRFGEMHAADPIIQGSPNFGLDLNWLPTLPLLPAALRHAMDLDMAIYDGIYVALAMALDASFCTSDKELARKLQKTSIATHLI